MFITRKRGLAVLGFGAIMICGCATSFDTLLGGFSEGQDGAASANLPGPFAGSIGNAAVPPLTVEEGALAPGRPRPESAPVSIQIVNLSASQTTTVNIDFFLDQPSRSPRLRQVPPPASDDGLVHRTLLSLPPGAEPVLVGPELANRVKIGGSFQDGSSLPPATFVFGVDFETATTLTHRITDPDDDNDEDNDGVPDAEDNCPLDANPAQSDSDGDGQGDACDDDDDNDGVPDTIDNCPLLANADQGNGDGDALGDVCDLDADNDGVPDDADNCPLTANADQADNDNDAEGDACDPDDDNDGVLDANDNCPLDANTDQADADDNGLGDACDLTPAEIPPGGGNGNGNGGETIIDCNGNGIADATDIANCAGEPACEDCNGNGVPDGCDLDCNDNGVPDDCDITLGGPLFGSTGESDTEIFTIDLTTGQAILFADLNAQLEPAFDLPPAAGLAMSPDGRTLFVSPGGEVGDTLLLKVDVLTAQGSVVGDTGRTVSELVFLPDGTMIGSAPSGKELVTVDPSTGATTTRCSTAPIKLSALAISPRGAVYGTTGGQVPRGVLFLVDPSTCELTQIGAGTGFNRVPGLTFLPDGRLIGSTQSELIEIDTTTGLGTLIAPIVGASIIDGLAFGRVADCNDNGIPDACDIATGTSSDENGNDIPDECELTDCNGNGIADDQDIADCSGDPTCGDCDQDGEPDVCSWDVTDCDLSGFSDECEIAEGLAEDCNTNGVPDVCEALPDCNSNGVPDECDLANCVDDPDCDDCNGNSVPDECDIADCDGDPACEDCNSNGVPDGCEIPFAVQQTQHLFASGAATNDFFGSAASQSGNITLISEPLDGSVQGAAQLFDVSTGQFLSKIMASVRVAGDQFGFSVGINGNAAIIGAPAVPPGSDGNGSAYLFNVADPSAAFQTFQLNTTDVTAGAQFGFAVAVDAGTGVAVVGAPFDNGPAGSSQGSVYLFNVATGLQLAQVRASDAAANDTFGKSVAIRGNVVIVGSPFDDDLGNASGSAYVFDVSNPAIPVEVAKIVPADGATVGQFGGATAIGNQTAIVGGGSAAYLFDISTPASPIERAKLTAFDAAPGDDFGESVAISSDGTIAVVGARRDDDVADGSGSAYTFDISDPANPVQGDKLLASDAARDDNFGKSVAVDGGFAVVGAWGDDLGSRIEAGSAYVFSVTRTDADGNGVPDECDPMPNLLFVDADATGPLHDGTSWCTAFQQLYEALDVVAADTVIRVADGTYLPDVVGLSDPRDATFQLINGVTLEGGYAGCGAPDPDARDVALFQTTLSGDLGNNDGGAGNGENSYHVLTGSGTDATAILDGFTITAGNANGAGFPNNSGGGMLNSAGSPTVTDCTISNNSATNGGGMANENSSPTLANCTLNGNSGTTGGGMHNNASTPALTDCTFSGNTASFGSGMNNNNSSPTLSQCAFIGNTGANNGGGMHNTSGSSPTVMNSTFIANSAITGGGMNNNNGSSPSLTNCIFNGNTVNNGGAGISVSGGTTTVINGTFTQNESLSPNNAGGIMIISGSAVVTNSVFWNNTGPAFSGVDPLVLFSDVEGGFAGSGNINADPLFVDPVGFDSTPGTKDDDLRLSPLSPCIDAGATANLPPDVLDLDGDNDTVEPIPFDLDANPRAVDDAGIPDCPQIGGDCGFPPVDLGAYESQPLP